MLFVLCFVLVHQDPKGNGSGTGTGLTPASCLAPVFLVNSSTRKRARDSCCKPAASKRLLHKKLIRKIQESEANGSLSDLSDGDDESAGGKSNSEHKSNSRSNSEHKSNSHSNSKTKSNSESRNNGSNHNSDSGSAGCIDKLGSFMGKMGVAQDISELTVCMACADSATALQVEVDLRHSAEAIATEEKQKREEAEAEVAHLNGMLLEKIAQLEGYKTRLEDLEKQLAPLRNSCAAYQREQVKRQAEEASYDETKAADKLATSFIKEAHNSEDPSGLLSAMLGHKLMQGLANHHMSKLYEGCPKFQIAGRVAKAISKLKLLTCSTHHWHAYSAILTAIAPAPGDTDALKDYASEAGCSVTALTKAAWRRLLIDRDEGEGLWYEEAKAQYRNKFSQKHSGFVPVIIQFHASISQPSANKKDIVLQHAGGKVWHKGMPESCDDLGCESHVKHYRLKTYAEAYGLFAVAHPQIAKVCSMSTYRSFEPFYIKRPEKSTCLCIYHERFQLLLKQYREMSKKWHGDECSCECGFCETGGCKLHVNASHGDLADHLLCPKPAGSDYHKESCVRGRCVRLNKNKKKAYHGCGWNYPKENSVSECAVEYTDEKVEYIDYQDEKYTTTKKVEGEAIETEHSRKIKATQTGTRKSFMEVFRTVSTDFFEHSHVARWQGEDFELLIDNLPINHAVFLEDFSMDYAHVHQVSASINLSA